MVDEDGNDEVCETHAREHESSERSERPERHLELSLGVLGALERKDQADPRRNDADGGECAEYDENQFVWQRSILSIGSAYRVGSTIFPMNSIVPE